MDQRRPPEYILDVFADPTSILHTIFFHRYFTPIRPLTRDLLDMTLPAIDDVDLETMIEQRTTDLLRQIDSKSSYSNQGGRGQVAIFFAEKRRRKTYFQVKEEKTVWEQWLLNVTLATPRTETGALELLSRLQTNDTGSGNLADGCVSPADVIKVRRAMEKSLQKAALKIIHIVNRDKDHIPPITTTDSNPFPYEIVVNPKSESWGQTLGIF